MTIPYFCFHGHFYQAPRGNPFADDLLGEEPGAAPFRNFKTKATELCYKPNAQLGNFDLMSFNVGNALMRWMERNAPETYQRILTADRSNFEKWGVGNALAQPTHHAILPLCHQRDKTLMVRWGLITYENRYGHPSDGAWLPELGVDYETLEVLHAQGIKFTILGQSQVVGATQGGGPYWVNLPSGGRIAVFVRDDFLSNDLAFGIKHLGGAGRWARNVLLPLKRQYGSLMLLAVEGETFGYHHPSEEHFLRWLLAYEASAIGYEVTTLTRYFREHEPVGEVTIKEDSSWSERRTLEQWQGVLRRALDHLAVQVDKHYLTFAQQFTTDPEQLLTDFIRVRLGQFSESEFLREFGLGSLSAENAQKVLWLLWAEFYRQRMYTSASFYYEDLERMEARHAIADAAFAAILVRRATGEDLLDTLREGLALSMSQKSGLSGAQYLDDALELARQGGKLES